MPVIDGVVDLGELRRNLSADTELLRELVEVFEGELPRVREGLRSARRAHDWREVAECAHRIRGSLRTMGLRCAGTARQLERAAGSGCWPDIDRLASRFEKELDEAVPALWEIVRRDFQ